MRAFSYACVNSILIAIIDVMLVQGIERNRLSCGYTYSIWLIHHGTAFGPQMAAVVYCC